MNQYVFVGLECEIGDIARLDRFGQSIELADGMAANVAKGNGAIIPAEDFGAIGFTADELKLYAMPVTRQNAPDETRAKFLAAAVAFHRYRESLQEAE